MRAWPRSPGRAGSLVDTDRPIEVLFEREGLVWYRHLEFQSGQDPDTPRRCFEDNARGRKTKEIDPLDVHGNNNTPDAGDGIDLLQVKRKSGAVYDVLETRPYSAQHLPLTVTDAAGQTTTYTYNSAGQILTFTTPPGREPKSIPRTPSTRGHCRMGRTEVQEWDLEVVGHQVAFLHATFLPAPA